MMIKQTAGKIYVTIAGTHGFCTQQYWFVMWIVFLWGRISEAPVLFRPCGDVHRALGFVNLAPQRLVSCQRVVREDPATDAGARTAGIPRVSASFSKPCGSNAACANNSGNTFNTTALSCALSRYLPT